MNVVTPASVAQEPRDSGVARASGYRWTILGLTWLAFLICFVDRLAWGNVALDAGRTLDMQMTALGVMVTAFYTGYVLSNAVSGFASDAIGPRAMLGGGLLALGAVTFAFGFTRSFAAGICIQALMGLASGVDYSAGVKLNSAWFSRLERGRAFGFYLTATSLGVVTTNSIVPVLAGRWGWRGAYQVLGAATVVIGMVCLALVRNAPVREQAIAERKPDFSLLLQKPNLILVALAGFGGMWGTWGFAFWANALMVKGRGLKAAEAAGIMVLFGAGAVISKPVFGMLSDWLGGRRKMFVVACLGGFAPALIGFGWIDHAQAFRYMAPVLGVFAFVYSPLIGAIVAEIAGTELAASATGLTNALWQLGSVIVPVVVGALFQATGSFHAAFAALAAGPAIGAVIMAFVRAD